LVSSTPPPYETDSPLYDTFDTTGNGLQTQEKEQLFAVSDNTIQNTKEEAVQ